MQHYSAPIDIQFVSEQPIASAFFRASLIPLNDTTNSKSAARRREKKLLTSLFPRTNFGTTTRQMGSARLLRSPRFGLDCERYPGEEKANRNTRHFRN